MRPRSWHSLVHFLLRQMSVENLPVLAVSLSLEVRIRDETKGGRVDAVAQSTFLGGAIIKDVAEVTVAMSRADFGPMIIPWLRSSFSVTFAGSSSTVKLGHPHPLSNFCFDAKSGSPDTTST